MVRNFDGTLFANITLKSFFWHGDLSPQDFSGEWFNILPFTGHNLLLHETCVGQNEMDQPFSDWTSRFDCRRIKQHSRGMFGICHYLLQTDK